MEPVFVGRRLDVWRKIIFSTLHEVELAKNMQRQEVMTLNYFVKKAKDVKLADILSVGKLALVSAARPLYAKKYTGAWIVCERPDEARDNGYHFFKYVREKHPEKPCYYAIHKKSPDYDRVACLGNIIEYGSLKHWSLYLCAEYNISSQKGGKPNAALCAFLELMDRIDSKLVFLQHGVTINDVIWAHADVTQLRFFICSTLPEFEFIKSRFGYRPEQLLLTGFPRFDNLHDVEPDPKLVLIMPTWRSRFVLKSNRQDQDSDFEHSHYKVSWEELLNHPKLIELMERENLKIVFFPHPGMQPFLNCFRVDDGITIADWKKYDIQDMMKKASIMITDYSSVFFDMVYMKKPVIFYQFDYEVFRKWDYPEGYFDYKNNAFGPSFPDADHVIDALREVAEKGFRVSREYLKLHEETFPYYDAYNSKRIYDALTENGSNNETE